MKTTNTTEEPNSETPTTHEASTHTPAPWLENVGVSRHPRIIGGHRLLLIATTESSQVTLEERSANARLIAAAPELLEACREIIEGMIDGPNKTQKNVTAFAIHKVRSANAGELLMPSFWYSSGGRWSGTEGRQRQKFVSLVPLCRYQDQDDRKRSRLAIESRSLAPWGKRK